MVSPECFEASIVCIGRGVCTNAWRGQFTQGDYGNPTIMLEAIGSHDMWLLHTLFGVPGSNNDLNVLGHSEVFNDIIRGTELDSRLWFRGCNTSTSSILLMEYTHPTLQSLELFSTLNMTKERNLPMPRVSEKDVKRLFRVLQHRWHIIANPAHALEQKIRYCRYACILPHNMILEDKGIVICEYDKNAINENVIRVDKAQQDCNMRVLYIYLQADFVEYIWNFVQNNPNDI